MMTKFGVCLMMCACSAATSADSSIIDSGETNDSPFTNQDANTTIDGGPSDSRWLPEALMKIPDALIYEPTYTCVDDIHFIECDYGDAQPCQFKNCQFDQAPVCANGRCISLK